MMKLDVLTLLVSCLLFAVELSVSAPVSILDADPASVDLDNIARNICWKNSGLHNQISRLSTIHRLIEYFEGLPVEHQFSSCARRNLPLLKQLHTLLSTGNENVCSNEKLAMLESFHHNYISNQRHARLIEAPKMIRTFFMHYSVQLSELCAQQSVQFFASSKTSQLNVSSPALDGLLREYVRKIGSKDKLDSYHDLFFVWGVVESVPKGLHAQVTEYVVSGPKRITLESRNAESFSALQELCLEKLKPVYYHTLLPAMRLIDLGYYPSSSNFLNHLNESPFLSRLYKLALLCETSLPVRVIQGQRETVLVKPEGECGPLDENELGGSYVKGEPISWRMADTLATVNESQAKLVARRVAEELAQRRRHLWKAIKRVLKGMKKSQESQVILSESKESLDESARQVVESSEVLEWNADYYDDDDDYYADHQQLVDVNEADVYAGSYEDAKLRFPTRRRRDIRKMGSKIMKVVGSLCRVIVTGIVFAIKLVVGLLTVVALFLATVTSMEDVKVELNQQLELMKFD